MLKLEQGRPADTSGRQEKEIRVYDFLDKLGVIYDRVDHEALMTMEACEEADRVLEATICKNLFLCTANKKEFYLLMIVGDKRLVTKDVHVKRIREKIKDGKNWSIATVWGIGYKFEVK